MSICANSQRLSRHGQLMKYSMARDCVDRSTPCPRAEVLILRVLPSLFCFDHEAHHHQAAIKLKGAICWEHVRCVYVHVAHCVRRTKGDSSRTLLSRSAYSSAGRFPHLIGATSLGQWPPQPVDLGLEASPLCPPNASASRSRTLGIWARILPSLAGLRTGSRWRLCPIQEPLRLLD